jgi:hypothetical protein
MGRSIRRAGLGRIPLRALLLATSEFPMVCGDPRPVLTAAREARSAAGWACGEVPERCAGFHCSRDGVRIYVGIERVEPGPGPF